MKILKIINLNKMSLHNKNKMNKKNNKGTNNKYWMKNKKKKETNKIPKFELILLFKILF